MLHHELEKFLNIVEYGSYSAAAKHRHVSQPALTSAIKSLEKHLGAELILRNTRPITLTPAGELVYELARKQKLEHKELTRQLNNLSQIQKHIKIGAIDSIAQQIITSTDNSQYLQLYVDNSRRLLELMNNGQIDLCFITTPTTTAVSQKDPNLVAQEKFNFICNRQYSETILCKSNNPKKIDIATYNPESTTYKLITSHLDQNNISFDIKFTSTSPNLIFEFVKNNHAAALLPSSLISAHLDSELIVELKVKPFKRPISLITKPRLKLTPTHQQIIDLVKKGY
jgi:DNA-binding transcriptional LysR family regulator